VLLARRKMSDCEPGSQNCEPGSQFRIVNQAAPHPLIDDQLLIINYIFTQSALVLPTPFICSCKGGDLELVSAINSKQYLQLFTKWFYILQQSAFPTINDTASTANGGARVTLILATLKRITARFFSRTASL